MVSGHDIIDDDEDEDEDDDDADDNECASSTELFDGHSFGCLVTFGSGVRDL